MSGEEKKAMSIRLSKKQLGMLKEVAHRDRRSVASLAELCIERYMPHVIAALNERDKTARRQKPLDWE